MIFLFNEDAGNQTLHLRGEDFKYLIKVRRHKEGDLIAFRNPKSPAILYSYTISHILGREVVLTLVSQEEKEITPSQFLHVGWCVIDNKSIEKVLPMLNEIGVGKISFIYCDRSQKNFKPDLKRFERILRSSMQQCGRSVFMEFEIYKTLHDFLKDYPRVKVFDFCKNYLTKEAKFESVLIGCEGGFSKEEKALLADKEVFALPTPLVLRSESAVCAVASKILL